MVLGTLLWQRSWQVSVPREPGRKQNWISTSTFQLQDLLRNFKKSPTVPTERTPKPEYLIALATSLRGPLVRSHSILMEKSIKYVTHLCQYAHKIQPQLLIPATSLLKSIEKCWPQKTANLFPSYLFWVPCGPRRFTFRPWTSDVLFDITLLSKHPAKVWSETWTSLIMEY